jgi:hypothetical protein
MRYYIWHDEGQCHDVTDDLEDARRIEKWLVEQGQTDAYITDENHNVIDKTYV